LRKVLSAYGVALLLILFALVASLLQLPPNLSFAQAGDMTFTSGDRIDFVSTTEMAIQSPYYMSFGSNVSMNFTSGIEIQFVEQIPDGVIVQCDWLQLITPWIPDITVCSWWEVIDPATGQALGEFHIDAVDPPFVFHVDIVWPGPIILPHAGPFIAEKKIEVIEPCQYYEVHWPSHWWPQPCTWWELIDPETGELTGVEFHVDWTNESCEFHIDEVLIFGNPGGYILPFPWWKLTARQKIPDIKPCDYFVVHDPPGWYPEPCTWWEVIDPYTGLPSGFEFHVDWSNESCEFHVDEVLPGPDPFPWYPPVLFLDAEQKITDIQSCDWFIIVGPQGFLPNPCTWWEVLDVTGAPTGLEFHVDVNDGFTMFHVDETLPGPVLTVPPSHTITVRQKIDTIIQCDWFKVADPTLTPAPCTWWEVLDDAGNPTGWEFHVDASDVGVGEFHVDQVIPGPAAIPLTHELTAERKIDTIQPCDWFTVIDPPTGWVPAPCSYWEIIWPTEWAGTVFHVDSSGAGMFHVDYVPNPIQVPRQVWNVTAQPYELPPPPWFKKPSYPDYAPSGMPDFDQKQDQWGPAQGIFTWCGPVAVANSLWWFDSQLDPSDIVLPYGQWDDHDPRNVDPLVRDLAFLMDTDGRRTGLAHFGTDFIDMQTGISQYLQQMGINPIGDCDGDGDVDDDDIAILEPALGSVPGAPNWDMRADIVPDNIVDILDWNMLLAWYGRTGSFYEHTEEFPDFLWIEDEIYRCEDVVLFLEFWFFDGLEWIPLFDNPSLESGHYVTCAGVNSTTYELLIADPYSDAAEAGWPGDVPVPHPYPHPPTVHNDTQYVSHDAYGAALWMGPPPPFYPPVPVWELMGYLQFLGYPPEWHAFIRAAIVTSPIHDVAVTDVFSIYDWVYQGDIDPINVTVQNQGPFTESVDVTAYYNGTPAAPTQIIVLNPGESRELTFDWDTTGVPLGNYTVSATAVIPFDNDPSDNFLEGNVEEVREPSKHFPWDVTGDGYVGIDDIVEVAEHFGQDPLHPDWDPKYDITGDNYVGIDDIVAVAEHFGEQDP
jgi:hypothetical protein